MITVPLILGWIGAAVGIITSLTVFFKIGPERRKMAAEVEQAGADVARKLSESAVALLQPSMDQVGFLRTELAATRTENAQLRAEQVTLSDQIASLRAEIGKLRAGLTSS